MPANTLKKNLLVFAGLWLLTFVLYLPAAKAGWVWDSVGWLHNIRTYRFWDYINNTQSGIPSLYQFTQLTTYILYKVFGANPYAWHTLMVSMHAANAFLLFSVCSRLFRDSGISGSGNIALAGVFLYTVCPHISETIVWEAAYHYLQGFLLILIILRLVQMFQHQQRSKYAVWAAVTYFCATYSLEIFYLTPWFVLLLALYYRHGLNYDKVIFSKTVKLFFIPLLLLFVIHIVVLEAVYHYFFAHIGNNVYQPFTNYICKPARYIFHILFLGRFFPFDDRQAVYTFIGSNTALIVFYNIVVLLCLHLASRFRTMSMKGKAGVFLFACIVLAQGIILPLMCPTMLLVNYDRYTYFLDAFVYMLLALLLSYITQKIIFTITILAYGAVNVYFTTRVNLYWKHSAYIVNRLLKDFPDPGNKTVVLLNLPQNMKGIPMIYANEEGNFKTMLEQYRNSKVSNRIDDVVAYNMNTKEDGAHVLIHNDTTVTVTLNQWGTWWWYQDHGAESYENEDYKLDMRDMGHWYDMKLKKPADQYLLLYNVGDRWKVVDINKKNEPQY